MDGDLDKVKLVYIDIDHEGKALIIGSDPVRVISLIRRN